jgi:hypothetical protein
MDELEIRGIFGVTKRDVILNLVGNLFEGVKLKVINRETHR